MNRALVAVITRGKMIFRTFSRVCIQKKKLLFAKWNECEAATATVSCAQLAQEFKNELNLID